MNKLYKLLTTTTIFWMSMPAYAACNDDGTSRVVADGGSACVASASSYTYSGAEIAAVYAKDAGTSLDGSNIKQVTATNSSAIYIAGGAQASFGDVSLSVSGTKHTYAVASWNGANIELGNVKAEVSATGSEGMIAWGGHIKAKKVDILLNGDNPGGGYGLRTSFDTSHIEVEGGKIQIKATGNVSSMSALRATRSSKMDITGYLNILTTSKNSRGVYASQNSVINIADTDIKTEGANSEGLRIGKKNESGQPGLGSGTVNSSGVLNIETLDPSSSSVRIVGQESALNAAYDGSSGTIKSAGTAIWYEDNVGDNVRASFRSQDITTTSADASLIKVGKGAINDTRLNLLSSKATAATNGYLLETAENSTFLLNATEGTKLVGSIKNDDSSELNVNLDASSWEIKGLSGAMDTTSSLSQITLNNNSILDAASANGIANYTIQGNVINNDSIISLFDGNPNDHLTIISGGSPGGNLSGNGTYKFDTDFENKVSDYITVNGNVTANGTIEINDITSATYSEHSDTSQGQSEAAKAANGDILLIEAPNDNDKSDESFILATRHQYGGNTKQGRFKNSPFVWELKTSGNDWVLDYALDPRGVQEVVDPTVPPKPPKPPKPSKPSVVAEIPTYTSLPMIAREIAMSELDALHTRLGELRNNQGWVGTGSSTLKTNLGSDWYNAIGFDDNKANAWLKGTINYFDFGTASSFDVSGVYGGFNLGIDKKFDLPDSSPNWSVYTGLFGGYKTGNFETSGKGNRYTSNEGADIDIDTWSMGGYASFFNTAGTYIDLVVEYMNLSANIDAAGLKSSTDGYGLSGTIEVGHSFDLDEDWIIEPQAQLKIAHIDWDDFNDGTNDVLFEDHTYVTGRAGLRLEKTIGTSQGEIKPWGYIGIIHEFTSAPDVTYASADFATHDYGTVGEIKLGITADVHGAVQLYGDVGYKTDFNDYSAAKGDLGVRIKW